MATSSLLFPNSSDEEEIEELSDREDQSNDHELQQFQLHLQPDTPRDQPSTSTDPTDDDAQQDAPPAILQPRQQWSTWLQRERILMPYHYINCHSHFKGSLPR